MIGLEASGSKKHNAGLLRLRFQLGEEPRLANSCFTRDADSAASPRHCCLEMIPKDLEFGLAADHDGSDKGSPNSHRIPSPCCAGEKSSR